MEYTFSLSRRSLPVRCLCLLLIVLVLWCFFMVPRAGAVALEATTIAYGGLLVGTILVGAGVVFSSHGDMVKVGNAMYKTLVNGSSAIGKTISSISAWAVEHGKKIGSAALRIGKDLYQGIVDAFNASYSNGSFSISSPSASDVYASYPLNATMEANISSFFAAKPSEFYWSWQDSKSSSRHWKAVIAGDYAYWYSGAPDGEFKVFQRFSLSSSYRWLNIYFSLDRLNFQDGDFTVRLLGDYYDTQGNLCTHTFDSDYGINYPVYLSTSGFYFKSDSAIAIPPSELVYPSDNYLVRMPDIPSVDTATGDVTYPNDTAYTKDAVSVPYPVDTEGVKVPDIPFDKVVDQSTGKALDDTGTDTDNPSKPGEGTDTGSNTGLLQKILDLLKNFFDSPSDFRLNMDGFRNLAIKDKFPFCIPFDMVDSVKQFAADAADYQFRVKLDTQYFKVDHVVDLTPLAVPLAFFRYLVVAWFAWVLMSRTHDLMKW